MGRGLEKTNFAASPQPSVGAAHKSRRDPPYAVPFHLAVLSRLAATIGTYVVRFCARRSTVNECFSSLGSDQRNRDRYPVEAFLFHLVL